LNRTPISLPDVFVPACFTPGTTALLVIHNHPSGEPTPSPDDARLTLRLAQAADILDMPLLDHLIVGDAGERQGPAHPQTTAQVRPRNDGPPIFLAATLYQKSNFRSSWPVDLETKKGPRW
jgi:hypothetical protein